MLKGYCRIHGNLDEITGRICKDGQAKGGFRLRCKQCSHDNKIKNYYANRQEKIDYSAKWKKENREEVNRQVREDKKNNPEKYKEWDKAYRERNGDRLIELAAATRYKISIEEYHAMIEKQQNKCSICKQEETRKSSKSDEKTRLCIDHDHKTGAVRDLLCHDCNTAIGKMKDLPELLLAAADYLLRHKGWTK